MNSEHVVLDRYNTTSYRTTSSIVLASPYSVDIEGESLGPFDDERLGTAILQWHPTDITLRRWQLVIQVARFQANMDTPLYMTIRHRKLRHAKQETKPQTINDT